MMQLHLVVVEERPHEAARWHPEPPLMESHEAYHVSLRGRRLPVVEQRHPPLWLGPAHPRSQKTIADQLLQLPLRHRGTSPRVRGKDLALARHGRRKQCAAAAEEEVTAAVEGG
jgi:hypothetical protein